MTSLGDLSNRAAERIERAATRLADWVDPEAYKGWSGQPPVAHMLVEGAGQKLAAPFRKLAAR